MKKIFVFVPVILLLLFLLTSYALKEKEAGKQTTEATKHGPVNIVFKSTDGGQTWQDISKGLPENLRKDGIRADSIFANDKGLFLKVGNELYHSTANATTPFWTKAFPPGSLPRYFGEHSSIAPGKNGIFAYHYWGVNLTTINGTSVWSPLFDTDHEPRIRSVFETAAGTIFLGTNKGLFKTADNGKTWKHVYDGAFVGHLAELNGVLVAIGNMRKIIRSTDNGENWALATGEGGVAWDVKQARGGFAAITAASESAKRTLSTSYDGGKTFQPIDAGDKVLIDSIWRTWDDRLVLKAVQTSITRVGEDLFCNHREGIFKSSDKGKTWQLLLPAIEDKAFSLFGSGNVIYAIPSKGGC